MVRDKQKSVFEHALNAQIQQILRVHKVSFEILLSVHHENTPV